MTNLRRNHKWVIMRHLKALAILISESYRLGIPPEMVAMRPTPVRFSLFPPRPFYLSLDIRDSWISYKGVGVLGYAFVLEQERGGLRPRP
ncbi:hypothetical protein LIER_02255 [Lithospermum erythrorhizon]|uniref:Uncharacterized protein n=1 Tax=Lithospermum erythrorhizon TaxID=34254 RepID=A0AAV3NNQ5_LITER